MALDRSEYKIAIKTTADLAGLDATIAKLHAEIEATKMLGKSTADLERQLHKAQQTKIESALSGITGKTKESGKAAAEASEGVEKLGLSHRQLHAVLEKVAPGVAELVHFLTSGLAGAVGVVLVAFDFLNEKIEQFSKYLEQLDTGPGAKGEWAEKLADNVREAAVEESVFNDRLRETAERQNTLSETTEKLIAAQKRQASDTKALGDAQKELDLARLELREKLGQITPDQAVRIRLEIDDAAFKRQLQAEKAAIQAELQARQNELNANEGREPQLRQAMQNANSGALTAKSAQDKNDSKLAQEKKDLEDLKAIQKQLQEGMHLDDIIPKWVQKFAREGSMLDIAKSTPGQIDTMIAQKTKLISQDDAKSTALAEAAAVAKQQAQQAETDYQEAAKLSADVLKTVEKLKGDLAAATAKNTALQDIHDQTSAARGTASDVDLENRVRAGHGTPQENQQVQDWNIQRHASAESGPQAGLDAADTIATARIAVANQRGQTMTPDQHAQIHALLQEIIGFQANQSRQVQNQGSALTPQSLGITSEVALAGEVFGRIE